jgi:3'(2'), 5'-bisphosphate nucleotidase
MGILGCPNLLWDIHNSESPHGYIAYAVRGQSAFATDLTNTKRISITVDQNCDAKDALFCESIAHAASDVHSSIAAKMGITKAPLCIDSQAKYAVLAAGHGELYLRLLSPSRPDYREKIWDQAAGSIVIEEAGGKVTDLDGKSLDFTQGRTLAKNRGVCGSNGVIHDAALQALKEIGA